MNSPFGNKPAEMPPSMHRDIMRSVKVVKKRYYLFAFIISFFLLLATMSYLVYSQMLDRGTFEFAPVLMEILKVDIGLVAEFGDEIKEFFPIENLEIWTGVLVIVLFLSLIIIRFRKALFVKVENFSDKKTDQN